MVSKSSNSKSDNYIKKGDADAFRLDVGSERAELMFGDNDYELDNVFTVIMTPVGRSTSFGDRVTHHAFKFSYEGKKGKKYICVEKAEPDVKGGDTRTMAQTCKEENIVTMLTDDVYNARCKMTQQDYWLDKTTLVSDLYKYAKAESNSYHWYNDNCQHFVRNVMDKMSYSTKATANARATAGGVHASAEVDLPKVKVGSYDGFGAGAKAGRYGAAAGLDGQNFGAIAEADIASASANAGPLEATVGLSATTGAGYHEGNVKAKILGTGFEVGTDGLKLSFFGTGFGIKW